MTARLSRRNRSAPWLFAAIVVGGLVSLAPVEAASSPGVLRYTMVSNGARVGFEVDTYTRGALDSHYEFHDRGRGPKIDAHYEFDDEGRPTRMAIRGVNYFKAVVDERLTTLAGRLDWRSAGEHGRSDVQGVYISNDGTVLAELAALYRLILRHTGSAQPLLPTGEAKADVVADMVVHSRGRSMHVREVALSGLDFSPTTLWVDDQGYPFAQPGSWSATIREGWEACNEPLLALQRAVDNARYTKLATSLARHPSRPVAFEHVQVFDAERSSTIVNQTVVVSGDVIQAVGPGDTIVVPANAERIDGRGKTLLPGLFDMHMHAQPGDGLLNIASGITSGRDVGNSIEDVEGLRARWNLGTAIGPRLWMAGLIDGAGPYQAPTGIYVNTALEAEAAVNRYADQGYVQIKLYSSLDPALVPGIIATAHRRGLRVSGHVPNGMSATQFVTAGADELQHINFVFLNFFAGSTIDTRTPARFTLVGERAATLDLDSAKVREFIDLLVAHHTTVDVTLSVFERMLTARPGAASSQLGPALPRLPAQVQRQAYTGGLPVTAENDARYKASFEALLRMTKKMYDTGVPILVGTDELAGFSLHRELELEVAAGIPAGRALQNATWLAARVLHQENRLGSIQPGKQADLLLVDGDPTQVISDIRRGRLVMKSGTVFDPTALYAVVGVAPAAP